MPCVWPALFAAVPLPLLQQYLDLPLGHLPVRVLLNSGISQDLDLLALRYDVRVGELEGLSVEGVLLASLALCRKQIVKVARNCSVRVVDELHGAFLEHQTHGPLPSRRAEAALSRSLAHRAGCRLVEVDAEQVQRTALEDHDGVVGSKPAQEWNEVAVAVPLDRELEVRQRTQATAREEGLDASPVPQPLELLLMHQKELDHARVLHAEGLQVLRFEIVGLSAAVDAQTPLQVLANLRVLAAADEASQFLGRGSLFWRGQVLELGRWLALLEVDLTAQILHYYYSFSTDNFYI